MSQLGYSINSSELSKATAWIPYVPQVLSDTGVGTFTTTIISAKYLTLGRLVFLKVYLQITALAGGPGNACVSLPIPPDTDIAIGITGSYQTGGVDRAIVLSPTLIIAGATGSFNTVAVKKYDGTNISAANNYIYLSGSYIGLQ